MCKRQALPSNLDQLFISFVWMWRRCLSRTRQSSALPLAYTMPPRRKVRRTATTTDVTPSGRGSSPREPDGKVSKRTATSTEPVRPGFYLFKSEPESRIENGVDMKFSIQDLAALDSRAADDGHKLAAQVCRATWERGEGAISYKRVLRPHPFPPGYILVMC